MKITAYIEHTELKPGATINDIEKLCSEAINYEFLSICVPPLFVKKAKELLAGKNIKVSTVIGFPFGYSAIESKLAEIVLAIIDGADELEMVINTSAVKNNDWQFLAGEINTIMPITRAKGKRFTVILETGLMTDQEILTACDIYGAAGVDFLKAGTGFFENDRLLENLLLIRKHLANPVQIKTGSVIKNYNFAKDLIKAGANLLCCNNSLMLLREAVQQN